MSTNAPALGTTLSGIGGGVGGTYGACGISVKTVGVLSLRFTIFIFFFGKTILIDKNIRKRPDRTTKTVFQEVGTPKNGMRKIKIPRKNVLLRVMTMKVLYNH